jgi:uncharacterized protein with FMN-binding domain
MTSLRTRPAPRAAAIGFASLGLVVLAGCAVDGGTSGITSTTTSGGSSGTSSGSSGSYTDGTYTAQASYQAPSGTESITVELTIANNAVTALTVTNQATDHEARQFQQRFSSGISAAVVGKDLSSLSVSRVSGSSLTSAGFNAAVEEIRSQAA